MEITQEQLNRLKERGLDDRVIADIAAKKGYSLPNQSGEIKKFSTGFTKGLIGDIARPTAQMLQGLGQRTLAAVSPLSLEEVRASTGLKSLDDRTPEGQSVVQSLKTEGVAEISGRVAANIASFFIPTSPATKTAGIALKKSGELLSRAGIGYSTKEAPLVQAYRAAHTVPERIASALGIKTILNKPITNADTVVRNKLFGTESMIGVQAKRASSNIWNTVIAPSLSKSKTKVNMKFFIKEMQEQVDKIPELSRRHEVQNALLSFADDYKNVSEITLKTLQKYKEGWAIFLPDKIYKGKPVAGAFKEVQKIAATMARNTIYKAIPETNIRAAYLDYGNLKNLQELGQKAISGAKLKGGAGAFFHGIYDKVITPITTTAGLTLYKTGEGIEFVGRVGTKILGHLFK